MATNVSDDPDYWRKRAEEARTLVDVMKDTQTKGIMPEIAESYEKIAKWVEERLSPGQYAINFGY